MWLRRSISALIALLFFAVEYPNVIGGGGRVLIGSLIYILCLSIGPFLVVVISMGRSLRCEGIGWCLQIVLIILAFQS